MTKVGLRQSQFLTKSVSALEQTQESQQSRLLWRALLHTCDASRCTEQLKKETTERQHTEARRLHTERRACNQALERTYAVARETQGKLKN